MKKIYLPIAVFFASALAVFPQTLVRKNEAPKFSSVYTDLDKDCKSALTRKEEREADARGQDTPLRCKAVGNYYAYIYYSALESYVTVMKNGEEDFIQLRPENSKFIENPGGKLEWRLADGKPFAVILRFEHFRNDIEPGETPYQAKYKMGESLVVKGLKGFERINFEIDARDAASNLKARKLADEAYAKSR